ncbi:MAG: substrate-binding domain-containing protein [Desulfomonilaceae bacterium]
MKIQLRKLLWIVPGTLMLMGAHYANAQDLSRMTTRDMLLKIRTMNVDQMSQIVRSMDRDTMTHIIQSMDSQTMSQIVRSLDPNTMSEIAKRILVEFAKVRPKSVTATARDPETNQPPRGDTSVMIATVPPAGPEQEKSAPDFQAPEVAREEQMDLSGLAVIVNPSNPVNELTPGQIRKIYTGEYTNWNQVNGPDLAIKVMTVGEPSGVQAKLTSKATVSVFASSVFLGVAGTTGSFGFVPMMQSRQLRFIGGHEAVKTMAVKMDLPTKGARTAHSGSTTSVADLFLAYGR